LEEKASEDESAEREIMLWYWGGRKLFQRASDSAADLKFVETNDDLQASDGLVNDSTLAMQSSGNT
jgi:hypothetical protein